MLGQKTDVSNNALSMRPQGDDIDRVLRGLYKRMWSIGALDVQLGGARLQIGESCSQAIRRVSAPSPITAQWCLVLPALLPA